MSSNRRLVIAGTPHHVMSCGNNHRRLFSFPHEYRRFMSEVSSAAAKYQCRIHTLMLRSHHLQLMVTPPDSLALPLMVKAFSQRYAQKRNMRRRQTGKLFQVDYACIPLIDERELALTTAFVELEPVRAGLVTDPVEWRWSTCGLHSGNAARTEVSAALWTPTPWYLRLGVDGYRAWLAECRATGAAPAHLEKIRRIEAMSLPPPVDHRIRRPDETRAS